jgi:hypothetical protein
MPYISTESVAAKRALLKKAFPEYKLSITRVHSSTICVDIMGGPIELTDAQVNVFYAHEHYEGEAKRVICGIIDIIKAGEKIISPDTDYGNVPNFYYEVNIGKWDKPYACSAVVIAQS